LLIEETEVYASQLDPQRLLKRKAGSIASARRAARAGAIAEEATLIDAKFQCLQARRC